MYPSVLRRGLVAAMSVLTLSVLVSPAHAATRRADASSSSLTDKSNDTVTDDASSAPITEPRADITAAGAEYRRGEIAFTMTLANATDPRTDPNWADIGSVAAWAVDTNLDSKPDYIVSLGMTQGMMVAGVGTMDGKVKCSGSPSFTGTGYSVVIGADCVGSPSAFNWAAAMDYDTDASDPDAPVAFDSVPDAPGDAMNFAGPVGEPATLTASDGGYWLVGDDGGIFSFNAPFLGSTGDIRLNQPIVGMAADPDGDGYWFVASDGGIFSYHADFFGSTGAIKLNKPIVGMAPSPTGKGYWLVASDGGIFAFGDAGFFGSTGAIKLNKPIVGMAATQDGRGYQMVASDGGIFAFGNAGFLGSAGGQSLTSPIVAMEPTSTGKGYWMVQSNGGVFAYGDAKFLGSASGGQVPVVGMAPSRTDQGYSIVRADGTVANFGDAPAAGSLVGKQLAHPIVGIAAKI